jgi:hypothetical protein
MWILHQILAPFWRRQGLQLDRQKPADGISMAS